MLVVMLPVRRLQRLPGRTQHRPRLEHEGHGVDDHIGFGQIGAACLFKGRRIRPMPAHAVVQRRAPGREAFGLGVVGAVHQAHEFAGHVAMEPRRPEGVLRHQPAWREDGEIQVGRSWRVTGRGEHGEDGRIRMVVADRTDGVETAQIVAVRRVVAVPADHVQRRVANVGAPQVALELGDELELAFQVFVGRHWRFEIARIGQSVGADRAQVGQPHQGTEVFAHVAA